MANQSSQLAEHAAAYLAAGLSVLPARRSGGEKRVALRSWKPYQGRLPMLDEVQAWFSNAHQALCLVAGAVSGNLEMLDFDLGAEAFEPWCRLIREAAPGLLERLVIETTPSGGRHVAYRAQGGVSGNLKLSQRKLPATSGDPIVVCGKTFVPRKDAGGNWHVMLTLIETRGEGGIFLCVPSDGYQLVQGDFTELPVLLADERETLLSAAWALNEVVPAPEPVPRGTNAGSRPGDDFSARGDMRAVLQKHGWTLAKPGENEYWRRPGKTAGTSATLKDRVFYVFSSNAAPFEPQKAYTPFAVYTHLEHGGDFARAAAVLRAEGYGADPPAEDGVDISGILGGTQPSENPMPPDPGPLPEEMLRVPGFVGEVMDHCLQTAPYPNPVMAFCGALALQAFLAGRKVRDAGDNRTNLYLLGLAHSSAGKDWPRKVNTNIVHAVGLAERLGERFASGEGIQDALFTTPSMLFQTDEIDGMLQSINKAKDARHENIMSTLLTLYSAANSVFPMRRKAGKDHPGVIDQPCLVIFGTAIPNHYYEALSDRMLTNGFFARMIIIEAGQRGSGQEPSIRDVPERVLETARWWTDYQPGERRGNLLEVHPVPVVIEHTDEARRLLVETRLEAEAEYTKAEAASDVVGTTVWGRVSEQVRKLALVYAVSEDHLLPRIGQAAVEWASRFVMHQTRRMLFMAAMHVADNPFHAECLKVIQKLRDAPGQCLSHQVLLKRMKMKAKDFKDLIDTLVLGGDVAVQPLETAGRTGVVYRLPPRVKEAEGVKEVARETTVAG
ncbi:MAG TPA: bifunctional DNA primase/polymerase [Phycisphaerae bacterium]|nr:bifunctional DNA primase/polymerase [Phycisphaerae bacterium]